MARDSADVRTRPNGPATREAAALRDAAAREVEGRPGVIGYAVVVAAVAVALGLYFTGASDLSGRGNWFVAGEAMGIAAAVLLALTGILAARLRPLEWLFGDMTKVYVAHGVVGLAMFGLVTVHPLLYVVGALPSTNAAGQIIVPFHLVVLDWISWILIALALLPTLYVRLRYDRWRYTHLLLGAAVVLTMVSLLITSTSFDTFKVVPLRIYLFVLFGLSILAIAYVAFARRLAEPKREYRVTSVTHHPGAAATELRLAPLGRPLRYRPGQFTYVDLIDDHLPVKRDYESHPFSISSAPGAGELSVIVTEQGAHTALVQRIEEADGARALVHGAYGRLGFEHDGGHKQIWIGGGLGVTPFLAMAEDLARRGDQGPEVTFVVGVDRREQAFYLDRLAALEERCPTLTVVLWARDERGLPTAEAIAEEVPDLAERVAVLSGPEPMVAELTRQIRHLGVPRERIHAEVAVGPPTRWRHASPALRVMRWVVSAELVVFVVSVLAAIVTRSL